MTRSRNSSIHYPTTPSDSDTSSVEGYVFDTPATEYGFSDAFFDDQKYVLVTGGLGYIGSHTVLELAKAGKNVVIIDDLSNAHPVVFDRINRLVEEYYADAPHKTPSIEFYSFDYRNTTKMRALLHRFRFLDGSSRISGVIHFAAFKAASESISIPIPYYSNNVAGLIQFIEILNTFGIKTLVFSSSAVVYGTRGKSEPIPEETCVHTESRYGEAGHDGCSGLTSPYGRTKWMCEAILSDLCYADPEWTVVALRYFNPVGCDSSGTIGEDPLGIPTNLMPVVGRVMQGLLPVLQVFGNDFNTKDGTGVRDFIHVSDLASGHVHALNVAGSEVKRFRTFNLGSGTGHTVLEVVNTMQKVSGRDVAWQFAPRREGDVEFSVAKPSRAEQELHWKTKRTLEDSCRDMYNFLSQNPTGYRETKAT